MPIRKATPREAKMPTLPTVLAWSNPSRGPMARISPDSSSPTQAGDDRVEADRVDQVGDRGTAGCVLGAGGDVGAVDHVLRCFGRLRPREARCCQRRSMALVRPAARRRLVRVVFTGSPAGGRPCVGRDGGWGFGWCARCRGRSARAAAAAGPVPAVRSAGSGRVRAWVRGEVVQAVAADGQGGRRWSVSGRSVGRRRG